MIIRIEGRNLPGANCSPSPDAGPHENVHVGIGDRDASFELFRGDAKAANWEVEVRVVSVPDGAYDFRGPLVRGPRGDRHIYLNWGTVDADGAFHLFRRAKVMLSDILPKLIDAAANSGGRLRCRVELTDLKGNPTCARFRPAEIEWSVDHATAPLSTKAQARSHSAEVSRKHSRAERAMPTRPVPSRRR